MGKKLYKEYRRCKKCGKRFEVKHKLRLYCDECKRKMSGITCKKTSDKKKTSKRKSKKKKS